MFSTNSPKHVNVPKNISKLQILLKIIPKFYFHLTKIF